MTVRGFRDRRLRGRDLNVRFPPRSVIGVVLWKCHFAAGFGA